MRFVYSTISDETGSIAEYQFIYLCMVPFIQRSRISQSATDTWLFPLDRCLSLSGIIPAAFQHRQAGVFRISGIRL